MPNALGEKIQKLRKQKELTLDQLAALTGSSKSYIWELENRNPPRPSAEKIARIAEFFEVEIDYLLDQSGEIAEEDAVDARFYRNYRKMDPETREKIRKMAKLIGREE
ncbi:helix-turn-helix transcriptional regulator [Thalassobaculum sp. OXR-137]|uniref:helix-turn-helix domain-containing protein n=1 Tax=Thalassobaculum sp. OXR-137 TaxID=3100173 RepID=UPI002AC89835|nr:helix-turn-helix transcriptional regulator [Thalassobaculum sp. OXR-137]WPZ35826.1 helix-turn-helix transcriptional regulator [Thalassobaculum sp. OXR-137]